MSGWFGLVSSVERLKPAHSVREIGPRTASLGASRSLWQPKIVSTFAQVVSPGTPVYQQVGYGLFMSLAHLLWFGVVAVFFSHDRMRTLMLRGQKILNKVIGSVLAGLGVSLAFAPSH